MDEVKKVNLSIIGESNYCKNLQDSIRTISGNFSSVLLIGEKGTGKKFLSRYIHILDSDNFSNYFEINCKSFTYEKSVEVLKKILSLSRSSFFKSTLYVSFINYADLKLQQVLLFFFDELSKNNLNCRVVSSCEYSLDDIVNSGKFDFKLYKKISTVLLNVLPLREHKEDILPLAHHYLQSFSNETGYLFNDFSNDAEENLKNYFWPGNVDELRNLIQHAFIVGKEPVITSQSLGLNVSQKNDLLEIDFQDKSLKNAIDLFKKDYVTKILEENGWNQTKTAKILGIQRTYVIRLINELHIRKK